MKDVVNNLLGFSKIEASALEINSRSSDLGRLINVIKDTFSFKADERKLKFIVFIADEMLWINELLPGKRCHVG